MLTLSLAGNLGRDAQYKTTQGGGELCSFSVAAEVGYGDAKQTLWIDVTRWGKGAEGLARILVKGSKVAVSGEMSTREHDGKTYIQCRADRVTIMGTPGERREPDGRQGHAQQAAQSYAGDDLDDQIPFVTRGGIW